MLQKRNKVAHEGCGELSRSAEIKIWKDQEPELSSKFRAGAMAIWEVAPALGVFVDTNGFAKFTRS